MDNIAQAAIGSLGIDIANLTARLSVANASLEHIVRLASGINPAEWNQEPVQEQDAEGNTILVGFTTSLNEEQTKALGQLLAQIMSLQ